MAADWDELLESWMLTLRVNGVGSKTREGYTKTLRYFRAWLDRAYPGMEPGGPTKQVIERYIAHLQDTPSVRGKPMSPVTIGNRYRDLAQWFRWLVEDTELYEVSPMYRMRHPHVPKRVVPAIPAEDIAAVFATTDGTSFVDRRDRALMLVLLDTGLRRFEVSGMDLDDVDLRRQTIAIVGKGDKERVVPFGASTALALDRYRRLRAGRVKAGVPAFWLSTRTPTRLTPDGIHQMLVRRSEAAGIPRARAHRWRHTMASEWMVAGGNELDLQAIMGWATLQMAQRYTEDAKARRALAAHTRYGAADRMLGEQAARSRRK